MIVNSVTVVFRQRGRYCLSTPMGLLTRFSQEEPFDLSQKPPGLPILRLSQSDGESVPGSSCQEEDEESLYRRSLYSPEVDQHEPEEREQRSPGEQRAKEKRRQVYMDRLDEEVSERESESGHSVNPRGEMRHLLQSDETSELVSESDAELRDDHEMDCSRSYDSDSDPELDDQSRSQKGEQSQKVDVTVSEVGRNQGRSEKCESVEETSYQDEEEETE